MEEERQRDEARERRERPGRVRVLRALSGETDNELMPWMIGRTGPPR